MWSLKLSKETFKFSGAHFTTFSKERAENLHGHNYYVSLNLDGASQLQHGMITDLNGPKKKVLTFLEQLDEKVLLPKKNPYLNFSKKDSNIEVRFNRKFYSFPKEDCCFINIVNITVEELAFFIAQGLKSGMKNLPIKSFSVEVCESRGQSAVYTMATEG